MPTMSNTSFWPGVGELQSYPRPRKTRGGQGEEKEKNFLKLKESERFALFDSSKSRNKSQSYHKITLNF